MGRKMDLTKNLSYCEKMSSDGHQQSELFIPQQWCLQNEAIKFTDVCIWTGKYISNLSFSLKQEDNGHSGLFPSSLLPFLLFQISVAVLLVLLKCHGNQKGYL